MIPDAGFITTKGLLSHENEITRGLGADATTNGMDSEEEVEVDAVDAENP